MPDKYISKHAEHLRLIHFTLVTVTTGMFIVASVSPGGPVASAFRDLTQISGVVEELNLSDWFDDYVMERVNAADRVAPTESTLRVSFVGDEGPMGYEFDLYREPYFFLPPSESFTPASDVTAFQHDNIIEDEYGFNRMERVFFRLPDQTYGIELLIDFKRMWDLLHVTREVRVVTGTGPAVLLLHEAGESMFRVPRRGDEYLHEWLRMYQQDDLMNIQYTWLSTDGSDMEQWQPFARWLTLDPVLDQGVFILADWRKIEGLRPRPDEIEDFSFMRVIPYPCTADSERDVCVVALIPVRTDGVRIEGHERLMQLARRIDPDALWREASFAGSFPELDRVTTHIAGLPLSKLQDHLRQELQRTGERFGVFGLSVPSSAVSTWGPVLIAILQLYFMLHLRRFNQAASSQREVFSFPWLGLYDDRISHWVMLLSAVLLPAGAVLYLTAWAWPTTLQSILAAALAVLSVAIAALTIPVLTKLATLTVD